jgi:tripeptidyl-peptidase I
MRKMNILNLLCILIFLSLRESISISFFKRFFDTTTKHTLKRGHLPTITTSLKYNELFDHSIPHRLIFAVKLKNMDRLRKLVDDISDPKNKKYGNHLTRRQVATITHPGQAIKTVLQYLESHGVSIISKTLFDNYIVAEAPVTLWNQLLQTKFYHVKVYNEITEEEHSYLRAKEYTIPSELGNLVDHIFNTVQIPVAMKRDRHSHHSSKTTVNSQPLTSTDLLIASSSSSINTLAAVFANAVYPAVINQYYHVPNNTGNALTNQSVYETINQTASPSDLTAFQSLFSLPIESIAVDIGGHLSNRACDTSEGLSLCDEANLDVQYLMGLSQKTPTIYYYWNGEDFMLDWIIQVANMEYPPHVISISYSSYEDEYDTSYLSQFDQEAIILAAIGVTIFAASGDDGVAGYVARGRAAYCGYYPQFPASSPMVTAVGATNVSNSFAIIV